MGREVASPETHQGTSSSMQAGHYEVCPSSLSGSWKNLLLTELGFLFLKVFLNQEKHYNMSKEVGHHKQQQHNPEGVNHWTEVHLSSCHKGYSSGKITQELHLALSPYPLSMPPGKWNLDGWPDMPPSSPLLNHNLIDRPGLFVCFFMVKHFAQV